MPKYKFNVYDKEFNSKKSVIDYVRTVKDKYEDFESLTDYDLKFMTNLLRYHPWGDQKIGVGVKRMWIEKHEDFPTRGFCLERLDGTSTDFSFYQCVEPASLLRDFKGACRVAIANYIIGFKYNFFNKYADKNGDIICPVSGDRVNIKQSHVDHESPTFDEIVSNFIEDNSINVEQSPLCDHGDGNVGNFFIDEAFKNKWVEFHNGIAKLRVISASANLERARKSY